MLRDNVRQLCGDSTITELELALKAETEAKHEAVEALRRVIMGEESAELSRLVGGILSKHEVAE